MSNINDNNNNNDNNELTTTEEIRENLVETARKFLENPNVVKTSLAEQQKFLKRKGLSDKEIRLACERSGSYARHQNQQQQPVHSNNHTPFPLSSNNNSQIYRSSISVFERFREFINNLASLSFVAYVIYKFYQKFIAPFLFGQRKKSVEESLEQLDETMKTSINDLRTNLTSVQIEVDKMNNGIESNTQRHLSDLKLEVATIKGLLLNRKLFPSVSTLPPSIPAWQKTSISHDGDDDDDDDDSDEGALKSEDMALGLGSSDRNTKNSDSSLEIISYSSKDYESDYHKQKNREDTD